MKNKTEIRANLEVRAALVYFLAFVFLIFLNFVFQAWADVDLAGILGPLVSFSLASTMAYFVYKKKKNGENPLVLMWVVSLFTVFLPFIAKLNYVSNAGFSAEGWTFALESYNSSMAIVTMVLLQQLLFNKRIALTCIVIGFFGWLAFVFVGINSGAEYIMIAMQNGKLLHGFVLPREFYMMIMGLLAVLLAYRNIPVIDNYDEQVYVKTSNLREQSENIKKALSEVKTCMKAASQSDLSSKITSDFGTDLVELKTSVNSTLDLLGQTLAEVKSVSFNITTSTDELAMAVQTMASGATEQAASIEEISSSMDEIESQIKNNTANADQSQKLSSQTLEIVEDGNTQMAEMMKSIQQINDTSTDVSKVIKVIDEIAFQTNLLALNAAVEAARAGKYGKGFAVVAEEVRNLASRSSEAAKDTTELINTSTQEVEKGVEKAARTSAVFEKIIESIKKVSDLVSDIAGESQEQMTKIVEVNQGLTQVNNVVQQNSAVSEETASASQELSGSANKLKQKVSRFKFDESIEASKT